MIAAIDDVEVYINRNDPFGEDVLSGKWPDLHGKAQEAFDIDEAIKRYDDAVSATKYTCPFCRLEYMAKDVRTWYSVKAGNKPAIPCCPDCACAGAFDGWGFDWTETDEFWRQAKIKREQEREKAIELRRRMCAEKEREKQERKTDNEDDEEIVTERAESIEAAPEACRERAHYGQIELF